MFTLKYFIGHTGMEINNFINYAGKNISRETFKNVCTQRKFPFPPYVYEDLLNPDIEKLEIIRLNDFPLNIIYSNSENPKLKRDSKNKILKIVGTKRAECFEFARRMGLPLLEVR